MPPTIAPRRGVAALFMLLGANIVAASCGGSKDSTSVRVGPPASLTIISGDAQSGVVGQELPQPVVVKVVDVNGSPVLGQAVNFRVTEGGGSVFAGASVTNVDGLAQERWTLGTAAGAAQTLEARAVDNTTGQALVFATFHATATPDAAVAVVLQTQPATVASSGQPLNPQPIARLADKYGNSVPQSAVQITAAVAPPANGRSVSGTSSVATNNAGLAAFTDLTVVGGAGSVTLTFSAPGLTAAASNAVTLGAGTPVQVAAAGPVSLTGTVGAALSSLPRVIVRDAAGNPVAGVVVNFAVSNGGGVIAPASATTDSNGEASLTNWTLPSQAGTYDVVASASAIAGASVTFTAVAQAGAAGAVARVDQSAISGQVGATLSPIQFRVSDSFGNPVAGAAVTFCVTGTGAAVSTGGATGSSASATSDASGLVSVSWTLGTAAGQQTLTVSITGGTPLTVSAAAEPGPAARVRLSRSPSSSTTSGAAFPTQPIVALLDQYGNAVAQSGVTVTATVPSSYTLVGSASAQTDASGNATFSGLGVSGPAGTVSVSFSASGLSSTSANVQVTAGQPASLTAVSPTAITDTISAQVASGSLPAVVLKDGSGNPVSGIGIAFKVGSEGGTVASGSTFGSVVTVTTDANGIAKLSGWSLPTRLGSASVTATALGFSVTFTASVLSGNPSTLSVEAKPSASVLSGTPSGPITVELRDRAGDAVSKGGVVITASAASPYSVSGGGSATTDPTGFATFNGITVTGPTGTLTLQFSGPGLFPVSISFQITNTGTAGPLASLVAAGGSPAAGNVTLTVQALDASGHGVPGVRIQWANSGCSATLNPTSGTTDSLGRASTVFSEAPGQCPGFSTVTASAPDFPAIAPAVFRGGVGVPCTYQWSNGNQTGERGETLALPLQLKVTDYYGNPVGGVRVQPSWYASGTTYDVLGTVQAVTTDATGLASSGGQVTLGSAVGGGAQRLVFFYTQCGTGLQQEGSVASFGVTTTPPVQLKLLSGTTSGATGATIQFVIEALDHHGWYDPSQPIEFKVTGSDGAFSDGSSDVKAESDNGGYASANYLIGASTTQQVTITSPGSTAPPLVITIQRNP